MNKIRLDKILITLYPEWSRSKIQSLIESGHVELFVGKRWKSENRPGAKFESELITKEAIRIAPLDELNFVSRGALKLKQALDEFQIGVQGKVCLDVGVSTGGFSDLLLQQGASKILGIDVGTDQLHAKLRNHPDMVYRDKVNARESIDEALLVEFFGEEKPHFFDLVVVDVSFISLDKIIPNLAQYMSSESQMITLLKPQFELSKGDLNKKGVVKDPRRVQDALDKIFKVLGQNKLEMVGYCPSPIEGENGNKEFLIISRIDHNGSGSGSL